ncbi:hypothetical protein ID0992_10800 [Helicobacter pylori]
MKSVLKQRMSDGYIQKRIAYLQTCKIALKIFFSSLCKFSKKDFLPTKIRFSFALEIAAFKRLESSKKERLPSVLTVE